MVTYGRFKLLCICHLGNEAFQKPSCVHIVRYRLVIKNVEILPDHKLVKHVIYSWK